MAEVEEVTFVNPHAGKTGRDGGPYLDQVEREAAEINRARMEGREPDFENATFSVGTPATPDYVMATQPDVVSHPSMLALAHRGSTNDGAEVLPVDRTTSAESADGVSADVEGAAGRPVDGGAARGEAASTEGVSVNSPLAPVEFNDPSANDDNHGKPVTDPNFPGASLDAVVNRSEGGNGDVGQSDEAQDVPDTEPDETL